MTNHKLLKELSNNQLNPLYDDPSKLPNSKGVYFICIKNNKSSPKKMHGLDYKYLDKNAVIYIGKSKRSLRSRDFRCHFRGTARNSTFRKSIGVLFGLRKEILDKGKYKFTLEDENWLSKWLSENTILYYLVCENPEETEQELINWFNPPLNLMGNNNLANIDFRKKLSRLRTTF